MSQVGDFRFSGFASTLKARILKQLTKLTAGSISETAKTVDGIAPGALTPS